MVWIVYKTTCLVNNKIYVGVHKTKDASIDDGYIGNGISPRHRTSILHPKFPFHYAVQKYGIENFIRETLAEFDNEEDAYLMEASIVTAEFVNRDDTYNFTLGGGRSHPTKGKIYQFDLDGNLINVYECIKDASNATGISASAIATSAREKKARRSFLWSFEKTIYPNEYAIKRLHTYYVYNSDGSYFKEFTSRANLLSELNLNSANVSRAIKRRIKTNGYYISYEKLNHFKF